MTKSVAPVKSAETNASADAGCCPWCSAPFSPRRDGGKHQRFCDSKCRRAFSRAAYAYALKATEAGVLTRTALENALYRNAAFVPDGQVGSASTQPSPRALLRPRRRAQRLPGIPTTSPSL